MIVASDIHLQLTPPRCRQENEEEWIAHQLNRLKTIVAIANEANEDLYIAGDIFDKAYSHPVLVTLFLTAIGELDGACYIMAGNHDLPNHAHEEMRRSSYGVLSSLFGHPDSKVKSIGSSPYLMIPYGEDPDEYANGSSPIVFLHQYVVVREEDIPPGAEGVCAEVLLKSFPSRKVFICGDNHHGFCKTTIKGRSVVNCGCVTKRTIDFQDEELAVWRINESTFEVTRIALADDSVLVRDSYAEAKKESEEKFQELIALLDKSGKIELDYVMNLKNKIHVLSADARKELEDILE